MPKPPIPWPAHWYRDDGGIRCIVPHCDFVTVVNNVSKQWTQLYDHCAATAGADYCADPAGADYCADTARAEHSLLKIMLRQSKCALCACPAFSGRKDWVTRVLHDHEQYVHGSAAMFSIDSFVVLVREGCIDIGNCGHIASKATCQRLSFDRMMGKVQALPAAELSLLFQRTGYGADEHSLSNLAQILSYDPLAQGRWDDPCWLPLKPDRFLEYCRPKGDDPADSSWRRVWRSLREEYADGRI